MHYGSLLEKAKQHKLRVGLIGLGDYGRSLLFQARKAAGLDIVAICDTDADRALIAIKAAGIS